MTCFLEVVKLADILNLRELAREQGHWRKLFNLDENGAVNKARRSNG